ncbi:CDGSH iron-sulfur domain-containing protein [Streptomyces sp. MBT58]|nr:CDGSH iron-sulfur domain-containing protein [Streptomyces sp. MBT58]MBK5995781.1 CDGSH iron-sulfur domain-containing protein [Streptomyces sp. MBT58]
MTFAVSVLNANGPLLLEGPVAVTDDDGTTSTSQRFMVAVCTCRRSRAYPWCDTSHCRRTVLPVDASGRATADAKAGGTT